MIRFSILLFALAVSPLKADIAQPILQGQSIIGEAFSLDGQQLQYRELHCISDSLTEHRVDYVDREGQLIAQKQVSYARDYTRPDFIQLNLLSNETIAVKSIDQSVSMSLQSNSSDSIKEVKEAVSTDTPLVIDAGFNAFVHQNWDSLLKGDAIDFQFPLASRSSLVDLRIQAQACDIDDDLHQCFRMDLSNWLFRMMVDPIELTYHALDRRLLRFRGLSNIEDEKGNGYIVDIKYQYPDPENSVCVLQPLTIMIDNARVLKPAENKIS